MIDWEKTIAVNLDSDLYFGLNEYCDRKNTNISNIASRLLNVYLWNFATTTYEGNSWKNIEVKESKMKKPFGTSIIVNKKLKKAVLDYCKEEGLSVSTLACSLLRSYLKNPLKYCYCGIEENEEWN